MAQQPGPFQPPPPPAPVTPPPAPLQPYTARADAALTELNVWGRAEATKLGFTWGARPFGEQLVPGPVF